MIEPVTTWEQLRGAPYKNYPKGYEILETFLKSKNNSVLEGTIMADVYKAYDWLLARG
jgi:hypothetical protein